MVYLAFKIIHHCVRRLTKRFEHAVKRGFNRNRSSMQRKKGRELKTARRMERSSTLGSSPLGFGILIVYLFDRRPQRLDSPITSDETVQARGLPIRTVFGFRSTEDNEEQGLVYLPYLPATNRTTPRHNPRARRRSHRVVACGRAAAGGGCASSNLEREIEVSAADTPAAGVMPDQT